MSARNMPALQELRIRSSQSITTGPCLQDVVKIELTSTSNTLIQATCGQYVRMHINAEPDSEDGYFAIASSPETSDSIELIVKNTGDIASALVRASVGDVVYMEGPFGNGFALREHFGRNIFLIGVGTGIAPMRSSWKMIQDHRRNFGSVHLYLGFLSPDHVLLQDEIAALKNDRIEVIISVSEPTDGWHGHTGFIQHALLAENANGRNASACLAGMDAMVDDCRKILHSLDFDDRYILVNH